MMGKKTATAGNTEKQHLALGLLGQAQHQWVIGIQHAIEGRLVHVEVDVSNGLPGFTMVGLPDASVRCS